MWAENKSSAFWHPAVLFCIGIFGLMLLSLLETIFVIYLRNKDLTAQDSEVNGDKNSDEEQNIEKPKAFLINGLKSKIFFTIYKYFTLKRFPYDTQQFIYNLFSAFPLYFYSSEDMLPACLW